MTFTFSQVERGISEAIRLECVRLGYLPDRTLYTDPADYEAAKVVIRNNGLKIIEVYGIGDVKARDQLNYNSIFINRDDLSPGDLGFACTRNYVSRVDSVTNKTVFDVFMNQTGTVTLEYQIMHLTDDTFYDRLISSIIFNVMKVRGFIYGMNDDGTTMTRGFNTVYRTTLDKSGKDYIERAARYDCTDIAIEEDVFLYTAAQTTDIDIDVDPGTN